MAAKKVVKKDLDYFKKEVPVIKTDYSKELDSNTKLKAYKTPAVGHVESITPLASMRNTGFAKTSRENEIMGANAHDSFMGKYNEDVNNINLHNNNVDSKVRQEEMDREAAEAQKQMAAAKHEILRLGGNTGQKFTADGIPIPQSKYSFKPGTPGSPGSEQVAQSGGAFGGMKYNYISNSGRGSEQSAQLSGTQASNINNALAIADKRGASAYEKQIMIATMMAESGAVNLHSGDRDSQGLFQQRPSQGWGSVKQVTDPTYSTNKFLDALKPNLGKGGSGWMDAQKTQRSGFSNGSNYRAYWDMAGKIAASKNNPAGNAVASSKSNAGLDKFVKSRLGTRVDYDGAYGQQCVDLFRYYVQSQGRAQPGSLAGSAASSLWTNPGNVAQMRNSGYKQVSKNQVPNPGDIVVFGPPFGKTSGGKFFGHVGVVVSAGGGKIKIVQSNSSTVGNNKPVNIQSYGTSAVLGYWR